MNLQELLKAWIITQKDINEYNQTWSFSKSITTKVNDFLKIKNTEPAKIKTTADDIIKQINKNNATSVWQKINELVKNKKISETNWKKIMWAVETYTLWLPIDLWTSWKIEPKKEVAPDVKIEEPKKEVVSDVKKEEPITKYEYKPSDAEMQQALERAKLTNQAYFDRVKWEYTQDYERAKLDIDRLIEYTNTDYTKQLAQDNKMFARSLDKATNVYWQRWLLWSWIQKSQVWEATDDYSKSLQNAEEYRKRKIEWYETQWQNIKTKYDRWMWDLMRWEESKITSDYLKLMETNKQKFYWNIQWAETGYFMDFLKNKWLTTQIAPYNQQDVLNKNTF